MDGVTGASQSIEAVSQLMKEVNQQALEMAEKMVKVAVETKVGAETGKGNLLDMIA
jgi:hypothetical protein